MKTSTYQLALPDIFGEADDGEARVAEILAARRYPLKPLLDRITCPPNMQQDNRPDFGKVEHLAFLTGTSEATVHRAKANGLDDTQADTWAVAAGLLPFQVWPEWWIEVA